MALVGVIGIVVGGCGAATLSANSTCRDYSAASAGERDTAVSKVAQDLNAPKAAGLGRPNVDNACIASPDATLGTVVNRYRPADQAPPVSSASDGVTDIDDTQALHLLQTGTGLRPALETTGFQTDSEGIVGGGTARDLITAKVNEINNRVRILPDGVTLEAFSRLLDRALITLVPPDNYGALPTCILCKARVIRPEARIDQGAWVVTFPPEGESTAEYLSKIRARFR